MIRSVKIQNFKNIRDQTIDLERFTVFVGGNGAGKTSVLQAIELAGNWSNTSDYWQKNPGLRPEWTLTRGSQGDIDISGFYDDKPFGLHYPSDEDNRAAFDFIEKYGKVSIPKLDKPAFPPTYLRLNATRLAESSYSDASPPQMEADGSGVASVLASMALNDPDSFEELTAYLLELLPRIKRIRFRKVPVKRNEIETIIIGSDKGERQSQRFYQGEAILFDYENAPNVAAHTASEGTLMILGLLTVLLGPDRPRVLLLDDIEHGLHPLAQKQLVALIGRIMAKFPELQIIATAHSPYLLNYLAPEQVRIMAVDAVGYARCGRLIDHPKFATWKDEMAPGEMWSLFGEKWLAGAEATP